MMGNSTLKKIALGLLKMALKLARVIAQRARDYQRLGFCRGTLKGDRPASARPDGSRQPLEGAAPHREARA